MHVSYMSVHKIALGVIENHAETHETKSLEEKSNDINITDVINKTIASLQKNGIDVTNISKSDFIIKNVHEYLCLKKIREERQKQKDKMTTKTYSKLFNGIFK